MLKITFRILTSKLFFVVKNELFWKPQFFLFFFVEICRRYYCPIEGTYKYSRASPCAPRKNLTNEQHIGKILDIEITNMLAKYSRMVINH